jgi:hypothetical protein
MDFVFPIWKKMKKQVKPFSFFMATQVLPEHGKINLTVNF